MVPRVSSFCQPMPNVLCDVTTACAGRVGQSHSLSHSEGRGETQQSDTKDCRLTSADVSERLLAKGRDAQRRKVELLKAKEDEEARNARRAVPISKGTESIIAHSKEMR